MAAANPNDRIPSARSNPMPPSNQLAERVRRYFDRHPEVSRKAFLLEAVRREIHAREQRGRDWRTWPMWRERPGANRWSTTRPRYTAEDIRSYAWLTDRLAVLHRERHGLWGRLWRVFFGSRLVRWLGLSAATRSQGTR